MATTSETYKTLDTAN